MPPLPQEQLEAQKDTENSNSVIAKRLDTDQPDAEKENSDGKNAQTQVEKEKPEKGPESKGQANLLKYIVIGALVIAIIVVYIIISAIALMLYDKEDEEDRPSLFSNMESLIRARLTGKASHDTEDKPTRSHTLEASNLPQISTADNGDKGVFGSQLPQVNLTTKEAIRYVSNESTTFRTTCDKDNRVVTGGYGFFSGFDQEEKHDDDLMITMHAFIPDKGAPKRYAKSLAKIIDECINEQQLERVNITQIINVTCTRWVCRELIEYPGNGDNAKTRNKRKARLRVYAMVVRRCFTSFGNFFGLENWTKPTEIHKEEDRMYEDLSAIYPFIFRTGIMNTENSSERRKNAIDSSKKLSAHIRRKMPLPSHVSEEGLIASFVGNMMETVLLFPLKSVLEFATGIIVPRQAAQTFLNRIVNTDQSFVDRGRKVPQDPKNPDAIQKRNARVVANVLGLAVVMAVKYAYVCTQAVDFYLQDRYSKEREEIIKISCSTDFTEIAKEKLMGYIREAIRINHPLGAWRRASGEANIPIGDGLPEISVRPGEVIFMDFKKALGVNDSSLNGDSLAVDPLRKTPEIHGMGLHRCPGIGLVEETMPEIFRAIFRLKDIRLAQSLTDHNPNGALTPDPQLIVQRSIPEDKPQKKLLKAKKWEDIPKISKARIRVVGTGIMLAIVLTGLSLGICFMISPTQLLQRLPSPAPLVSSLAYLGRSLSSYLQPVAAPTAPNEQSECSSFTEMQDWQIVTMKAGDDGKLIPLEYTLNHPTAHILSVTDVDAKDMAMLFWIDNQIYGTTPQLELNRSEDCGSDFADCIRRGFSSGRIQIPKGYHTVRVEWNGVETPGPDGSIDWGEEGGRRLAWRKDSCSGSR